MEQWISAVTKERSDGMWTWLDLDHLLMREAVSTLALVTGLVLAHVAVGRMLRHSSRLTVETRRRWIVNIRNTLVAVFLLGMILIWAPQLQPFAVTLIAVALALVFATKELLACLSGALLRIGVNAFSLGDRIEIGSVRGNVVDHTWFATKVLEIGPGQTSHQYTGRAMVFPNSLLLSMPVTNETYTKKYVLHITTIRLTTDDDLLKAEAILLDAAWKECSAYLEDAKRYMKNLEGRHWLDAPSVEPRVTYQFKDAGRVNLLLRVPCRAHETARMEQAILRTLFATFRFAPVSSDNQPQIENRNPWQDPPGT